MDDNKIQQNDKDIKVLRTYTSDMADAIRTNEISVIKIALAEKEKREREEIYKEAEGTNTSKTFLVIGGIILIVAALVGSYFLFQKKITKDIPQPIVNNIETFIAYDSKSNIDVTNVTNATDLLTSLNSDQTINTGTVKALFLTKNISGVTEELTAKSFLSLINTTAPGTLTRSLSDKYLLGKYLNQNSVIESDKSAMFLIFQTTNYSLTYASMLDWERTMLIDLVALFNINIPKTDSVAFERPWKDIIINNKDARVLYGENGEGILYYVFVNKYNFVITNNEDALKEVISRLIIKDSKPI